MTAQERIEHTVVSQSEGRVGLDGVSHIVRRHMPMMLAIVVVVVGITFLAVRLLEPRYRTVSTVVMTMLETRVSATEVELETFELTRAVIETEMDILRSREFAADVAEAMSLFNDPTFVPYADPGTPGSTADRREKVIDKTLGSYKVVRRGESLAIEIIATSNDPLLAAKFSNTVAETYILRSKLKRTELISDSITFLRARVSELGEELTQSELQLAAFIRQNKLDDLTLPDRLRAENDRLSSIYDAVKDDEALKDESDRVAKELAEIQVALHERTRSELALMRMERSIELLRLRYQNSIEKLNELETQLEFAGQGARQVSFARIPIEPYWPNPRVAVAVSGVAGLVLAFIAALLLEGLNHRLWSERQTARISGLANFGFLPSIKERSFFSRENTSSWFLEGDATPSFFQALRGFLTLWFNLVTDGKIVMITSGLPGEGKSTVAVSIAAAAAEEQMKVLVVDLDNFKRGATKLVGSDAKPASAADVLADKVVPQPVVVNGETAFHLLSLHMLDDQSPADAKSTLKRLNTKLRKHFDLVIVDTPPTLIVHDACRLGDFVDKTLIVVRWGNTSEAVLRDTVDKLEVNGIDVTGTIINDVNTRKHRRYGYGGGADYYSYNKSGYY